MADLTLSRPEKFSQVKNISHKIFQDFFIKFVTTLEFVRLKLKVGEN